jgi:hypothetical protein
MAWGTLHYVRWVVARQVAVGTGLRNVFAARPIGRIGQPIGHNFGLSYAWSLMHYLMVQKHLRPARGISFLEMPDRGLKTAGLAVAPCLRRRLSA